MISKIGPLVEAGEQRNLLLLHVIGGTLGGATAGALLGFIGMALKQVSGGVPPQISAFALAAVLTWAVVSDLRVLRLPRPKLSRQTPGFWICAFGERPASFAWGFDLGLGLSTRLPNQALLALPLAAVLFGDLAVAVALMTLFGLSRAAAVAIAIARSRLQGVPVMCDVIRSRKPLLRLAVAATSIFVAVSTLMAI